MKRVVIDIEANGLNPTKIFVICCKDIETGTISIFREPTTDDNSKRSFIDYARSVDLWIGHNWLGYDYPVLAKLLQLDIENPALRSFDTLVVSKLSDYSRENGHSLEAYGEEFGLEKIRHTDFTRYSMEMEVYCLRDVAITEKLFNGLSRRCPYRDWSKAIHLEQRFQLHVNSLHDNGFCFDVDSAGRLLSDVEVQLKTIDEEIKEAFPPREVLIREFTPRATKYGTISKTSVPRALWEKMSDYEAGVTYRHTRLDDFNPSSHKQLIEVLSEAGWQPEDKTQTHIDTERIINRLKYRNNRDEALDLELKASYSKLDQLKKTGWKINENNLSTLPESAPSPARALAKRILLEARRRTLTEWLGLVQPDGRIHGKFYGIGAWTHRMAHQNPNTANIPTDVKLYGKEMRSLWRASPRHQLVGVDAEGIQLRIFAHYIDDEEFTDALVRGSKTSKTDPHSLNQRVLGRVCTSRAIAKRFIYALLLGAGIAKLAQILGCSIPEAEEALARLIVRYDGFRRLKEEVLPKDGKRGYFIGLDGRKVPIPGDTASSRTHLAMSGYLQNGEAVIMKMACVLWHELLKDEDFLFVNMVHDEWQTEAQFNALRIAEVQADSLRMVGEELKLKCPLAGSYWNEDHKKYTIGVHWAETH